MENKTNVMRILDKAKIEYKTYSYDPQKTVSGSDVARVLNQNPKQVFKTLVTVAKSKKNYVFMLPVDDELDLKKCAIAVNEKNIEMIPQKELLPLTGYIHGGCSPIGQKKQFETVIDATAQNFETIIFSAGKIGYQIETSLENLKKVLNFKFFGITK